MTPAARAAAAIGLLDAILDGTPAEKALTGWARRSRYAGSGDRAAVRDLVFDALRRLRSYAWLGGAETGRGIMLGAALAAGDDPAGVFTGERHGPAPLGPADPPGRPLKEAPEAVRLDVPDWLLPSLRDGLGGETERAIESLRERAPAFLRANLRKTDRTAALAALRAEGIWARPHALAETAIEVVEGARRIRSCIAYREGLVELQDAASQAAAHWAPLAEGERVLDYCAGGGGKALALAARTDARITAHDADPARMRDLPARAARAGVSIAIASRIEPPPSNQDLVFCDAPCSGSGAWSRNPDAKWRLTPGRLKELLQMQARILDAAVPLVAPGGRLVYATCSLLLDESERQAEAFLARHPGWRMERKRRFSPLEGGDGFFVALFSRVRGRRTRFRR